MKKKEASPPWEGRPRERHVDKAIEVTKLQPISRDIKTLASPDVVAELDMKLLAQCDLFTVYDFQLNGRCHLQATTNSFQSLIVLEGVMELEYSRGIERLEKGDSIFIPADFGDYMVKGEGQFLLSMV